MGAYKGLFNAENHCFTLADCSFISNGASYGLAPTIIIILSQRTA